MLFPKKKTLKMSIHDTLTNNFRLKNPNSAMKPSSNYAIVIVYPYA